jgi:Glycosyltransferase family 87
VLGWSIVLAAATGSLLFAGAIRLRGLVSSLLAAYLVFVSDLVLTTVALSAFREVDRTVIAIVQAVFLAAAISVWALRGRHLPQIDAAAVTMRSLVRSWPTLGFLVLAGILLGYELLLVTTAAPTNWDGFTYHLARVAAWVQHGGIYWIANPPSDILNTRQPVAEQQIFFFFATLGKGRFFALPQYLAQLAGLVAVYGATRRLGFGATVAACTSALLATFSLVSLESTTAQNDLVAASFSIVAAYFILAGSPAELVLAGAAVGIGLGVKLTTVLIWPVLVLLLWPRRWRGFALAAVGAIGGFALAGMWGYVLNLVHTGRVSGESRFGLDVGTSPSFPGSLHTSVHVLYHVLDTSVLTNWAIAVLAVGGGIAALAVGYRRYRDAGMGRAALRAGAVAIPLAAPALVLGAAALYFWLSKVVHLSVSAPYENGSNRTANEDYSAFGPVGAVMLLGTSLLAIGLYIARRVDLRYLALALSLPVFLVLVGLDLSYNAFLSRFLLIPAFLAAPLFGLVLSSRAATASLLAAAAVAGVWTLADDHAKPLSSRPWQATQAVALKPIEWNPIARVYPAFAAAVPARACVGAVLDGDEPSYLLWGPRLTRRVVYLPASDAYNDALRHGLFYVVISDASDAPVADQFAQQGWKVRVLANAHYWLLVTAPHAGNSSC